MRKQAIEYKLNSLCEAFTDYADHLDLVLSGELETLRVKEDQFEQRVKKLKKEEKTLQQKYYDFDKSIVQRETEITERYKKLIEKEKIIKSHDVDIGVRLKEHNQRVSKFKETLERLQIQKDSIAEKEKKVNQDLVNNKKDAESNRVFLKKLKAGKVK